MVKKTITETELHVQREKEQLVSISNIQDRGVEPHPVVCLPDASLCT